jgi:hypothetical protein
MTHPNEEDLILHFYGERPEAEATIDEHLGICPSCQTTWTELRGTLQLVDDAPVPEPPAGFERVMWAKVQQRLSSETAENHLRGGLTKSVKPPLRWNFAPLAMAATVLLAVALGAYVTRQLSSPGTAGTTGAAANLGPVSSADVARGRERVLLTALDDHFQQSELLMVELLNSPETSGSLAFERATADDLIDSGRLYRVTAQQNGNVRLAAMLEDLELVLVEIARSPEQLDKKDLRSLRARIEDDNLLFKVRAVSQQIHDRQKALSTE